MVYLDSSREYVGAVDDPETGETVQLNSDVDKDVADRVTSEYHYLSLAEGGIEDENPTPEAEDRPTNADGEPLCVGKDDGQCSRVVDELGGRCWQH